jgi:hypothetical protein
MNCFFLISTTYPLENDLVHKIYSTIVISLNVNITQTINCETLINLKLTMNLLKTSPLSHSFSFVKSCNSQNCTIAYSHNLKTQS